VEHRGVECSNAENRLSHDAGVPEKSMRQLYPYIRVQDLQISKAKIPGAMAAIHSFIGSLACLPGWYMISFWRLAGELPDFARLQNADFVIIAAN